MTQYTDLSNTDLSMIETSKFEKIEKLMKIINIDEENLHIF